MTWTAQLSRDERSLIFDIVRRCVWADGRLGPDELSAARGIAITLDVLADPRTRGALSRAHAPPLEPHEAGALGAVGRQVAFVAAAWIAWVDGAPNGHERAMLARLASVLQLEDARAGALERQVARSARRRELASAEERAIEIDGLLASAARAAIEDGRRA